MNIKLGSKRISENGEPYVIAEIGVNHECSLSKAKKMIRLAKIGGADAVKFQFYKAGKIASIYSKAYWDTKKEKETNQFNLFKKFDKFDKSDFYDLAKYCKNLKIDFACTPFDFDSVDILNKLVSYFKISSSDITNIPLIKKIAKKNKNILLSTGASNIEEIRLAVNEIKKYNKKKIVLMHCILNYPTNDEDANLRMIKDLKLKFPETLIGYSDHTLPKNNMLTISIAYALGAVVIEKHFTDNKRKAGNDHYHSMDYKDLKIFKDKAKKISDLLGLSNKHSTKSEEISRKNARRSIVLSKHLAKNTTLKISNIAFKRPGTGISPVFYKRILGKKINKNLKYDHVLKWKNLKKI
jgi:sialic acid synthase SpsE